MNRIACLILTLFAMKTTVKSQQLSASAQDKIIARFEKKIKSNKSLGTGILLIHSDSLGIHRKTAVHHDAAAYVHPDQPYHFASIGKTITSVLIARLCEQGLLDFDDYIKDYLDAAVMENLHVYNGVHYADTLRIKHLLNHTSGLADYYLDRTKDKTRLVDVMVSQPDTFWTPLETIEWTKMHLSPRFTPGQGFHYADTNYQLAGLIIERITAKPLHEAFRIYIFEPLGMNNTYMPFYSQPAQANSYPMVELFFQGVNLSKAQSISMSWASGGVVSTSEDMLKFHKSIVNHEIVSPATHARMQDWAKMGPGMTYGYGMIRFNFLMMPRKYTIWGNSGSIGAFMYYNPAMDVYLVGSFHKMGCQVPPVVFISKVLRMINKDISR